MKNLKKIFICLIFVFTCTGIFSQEPNTEKVIVFSVSAALDTFNARLLQDIYTSAFNKLGYGFKFVYNPPSRALIEADSGRLDGCDGRLSAAFTSIENEYPNLIFGDEAIFTHKFSAFVLGDLNIQWDTLLSGDYQLSYVRGLRLITQRLKSINDEDRIIISNDPEQTIKMLVSERVKVAILSDASGLAISKKPEYKDYDIQLSNDLITTGLYTVMNKKHKDLVIQLSDEIRKMKDSGEFKGIIDELEKEFKK